MNTWIRNHWAGLLLCLAIAVPSWFLGKLFPIVGGAVIAILAGMVITLFWKKKDPFEPGIKFTSKKILQWAVILLGFGLDLNVILETGRQSLPIIVCTIATALLIAFALHKALKIPGRISTLVGVGSSICGGSAIAATAPVIGADDEEVAQAISVIFFFNVLAAILFPPLGQLIGFDTASGEAFGIFAGTAVNDTSSVTAAAATWDSMWGLGSATLDKAVTVKLTRTLAIIPITLVLALVRTRKSKAAGGEGTDVYKRQPRNPATIADNVGDNVGDVAGMGADLYESYVGSILATFALGACAGYGWQGMLLPMALAVCGIICSIIGSFLVKTKEDATQKSLLTSLRTGTYTAAILSAIVAAPLCYFILGPENNCWGIFIAILCGLIGGTLIGYFTEYFTSDNYKPTKKLAAASETGAATIIIGGISLGLMSTIASILIVAVAILISYFAAGGTTSILDEMGGFSLSFNQGLYGIGIAGVGMLSTLGITLATDAYGPVADNAGGIAEMSGLPEEVRDRTDALDSLGNTTAATGKGFAIGSASLTALALLVSYVNIVQDRTVENLNFTLTSPTVLVGLFIGAMLTFVFSAMTMRSVQTAAQSIVVEVRRQFREIAGIMEGKTDPEYGKCVALCTKGALHEMVAPALLAIIVPIITGLILGPTGVVGLLGGVSVTGFAMAVFMSNAGGAWDNAKKYIERGNHGGKGSEQHKAAVVGDTVGDPFKDTSGPSLNILIKLCSTVSIVFSGLVLAFHLL